MVSYQMQMVKNTHQATKSYNVKAPLYGGFFFSYLPYKNDKKTAVQDSTCNRYFYYKDNSTTSPAKKEAFISMIR